MTSYGRFDRWTIESTDHAGAARVPLGPFEEDWLPDRLTATVTDEQGWRVEVDASFDGTRIAVPCLTVSRPGGVRPTDLTALSLPRVVQLVAETLGTADGAAHIARRPNRKPQGEELDFVAAAYCWAHATWGRPRQAVERIWALKPATASYWIAKAREVRRLPMPHGDQEA